MPYLEFISDKDLCSAVTNVISVIEIAEHDAQIKLHKNVVDPFRLSFMVLHTQFPTKNGLNKKKQDKLKKQCKTLLVFFIKKFWDLFQDG